MIMSHPDNTKSLPALAPGPPRISAPHTSTGVSRPKKNSTACLACKAAKRKCSGPPGKCKACSASNLECLFDPSRDLRRKVAVKRTIQELTDHKDLLNVLLDTIRSADQFDCDKVVGIIRNSVSKEEVARVLGSPATKFEDSHGANALAILDDQDYPVEPLKTGTRRASDPRHITSSPEEIHVEFPQQPAVSSYARITLESLCDIPLFEVQAKPWTQVTDDDYLVSHLVSLYFTWDHPCSQFLDQGAFIAHMRRGNLNSEFCAPILVNSLLSMASAYSDSPDVLSNPGNAFSRGRSFFCEAERLWKAEKGRANLTNIQALLLMCCVLKFQGQVQQGWLMLRQAVRLAEEMGLLDVSTLSRPKNKMLPEIERVRTITAWGISHLSSELSLELQWVPAIVYPALDIKLCGDQDFDWTPYPRSNQITYDKRPACLPGVREGMAQITKVLIDVQNLIFQKGRGTAFEELWRQAEGPFDRLTAWLGRWPQVIELEREPIPQVLLMRVKCLHTIMSLFDILNDPRQPRLLQQAWYYQINAAEEMAQCLRIYRESYGLKHIPSQMVDATQTGLRILACQLDDSDELRQAFVELSRFGTALSKRFKRTADKIHEIRAQTLSQNLKLPSEAVALFDDPEHWEGREA
ncbi:hypothetical protein PENANT_c025G05033 [Penicillium antarcticum]|uniref:Zn(2)-C6 fungal-type domain-containing protein n=1 Tax=Penicillium antarcticum TaxID=416450 RepID=A0A1V6PXS0_9EURO|nr:uncharacterized protein N7508_000403 [Penicillium antarcticum]KAJ5320120.1 hypothetical protein N7508_000403 [Penicillium antarcticum]OQD81743.1 hypothetical protein PENANT_c025G05033 [Penicillium antarcticum]